MPSRHVARTINASSIITTELEQKVANIKSVVKDVNLLGMHPKTVAVVLGLRQNVLTLSQRVRLRKAEALRKKTKPVFRLSRGPLLQKKLSGLLSRAEANASTAARTKAVCVAPRGQYCLMRLRSIHPGYWKGDP